MILCLETSTKNCSVALGNRGGDLISIKEDGSDSYTHAEKLHVFIQEVLDTAGIGFSQLDAVAVSEGPGSYTGLRIGVSSAKGMAYALGLPLIAVKTLEAMAQEHLQKDVNGLFIPMIDARRMEVFCAGFSGSGESVFDTMAQIIDKTSFSEFGEFSQRYYFGDGAEKCEEILAPVGFTLIKSVQASAAGMASLAAKKYASKEFVDTAYFEPFYLKDFVAGKKKKARS